MANVAANLVSGNSECSASSWKTLRKLIENNVFNCECCGSFFKTAVFLAYGIGTVCEDCLRKNEWPGERLKFFDAALQELPVTPCSNAGCKLQLLPEDLEAHLEICKYRLVNCLHQGCYWQNKQDDLAEHFEKMHGQDVIAEETAFNLDISLESFVVSKLLIKKSNKYFITIRREVNSSHILYNVFKVIRGNVHNVYLRHFCDGSEDYRKHIETEELDEIDRTCALNKISLVVLKEISEGKNELPVTVTVTKSKSEEMLSCSGCGETMRRPIYQCKQQQHNVCSSCSSKSCQVCHSEVDKSKTNFSREALTSFVYYTCVNQPYGCEARYKGDEIERHELRCPILHSCPIPDCSYKNRSVELLKQHFSVPHKIVLQGHKHEFIIDLNYNHVEKRYVYFDGCFFEVQFFSNQNLFVESSNGNRVGNYDFNFTVKLLSASHTRYVCIFKLVNEAVRRSGSESGNIISCNIAVTESHQLESAFFSGKSINHGKQEARLNVCLRRF